MSSNNIPLPPHPTHPSLKMTKTFRKLLNHRLQSSLILREKVNEQEQPVRTSSTTNRPSDQHHLFPNGLITTLDTTNKYKIRAMKPNNFAVRGHNVRQWTNDIRTVALEQSVTYNNRVGRGGTLKQFYSLQISAFIRITLSCSVRLKVSYESKVSSQKSIKSY